MCVHACLHVLYILYTVSVTRARKYSYLEMVNKDVNFTATRQDRRNEVVLIFSMLC